MTLTYYGHSCFSVEIKGKKILFDPFITGNELAKNIDINTIEADYILLSHGHGDHCADAEAIAKANNAIIVAAYEIAEWYIKKGVEKCIHMNTGGKWHFDFGSVKCVSAVHSSMLPDGSYGSNPMGFVVTSDEINFYYSGDTALTLDMQLIPTFAEIDFAILPIGDCLTMGADDAVQAAKMVQTNVVVGVHYDTWGNIKIDHQKTIENFKAHGIDIKLLSIGESIEL
ncbi:metal-dependent hydrolase [Ferruginibacter albus]|uniref:metal-dependent hydrolase n=1 Tax=Ferruginibacter albus TaxID=2875540 RepID=UPI001CC73DFC|nr:metal-dependent hydrolase [Ferruginibacter albus]UAY52815.1 metal-dependent hydrolase [Ferruginibacter albus]